MTSKLIDEARKKGYSVVEICGMFNKANGTRVHQNVFAIAVSDLPSKSRRQEWITNESWDIVKSLPERPDRADRFVWKAREAGFTVRQIWEHYCATREKPYAYTVFTRSLNHPAAPFEIKLRQEAEECLKELMEK